MTYEEAEALKNVLKSDRYISKAGHELKIFIVPETPMYFERYKGGIKYYWETGKLLDKTARSYSQDNKFTLYGIRRIRNKEYSGGVLNLGEHPELVS